MAEVLTWAFNQNFPANPIRNFLKINIIDDLYHDFLKYYLPTLYSCPENFIEMKTKNSVLLEIIEDAGKAPSGHNTQPWKFEAGQDRIILKPDFNRRLKVVDADNHALFISLGCALENLVLSAKAHGFNTSITYKLNDPVIKIIVDLTPAKDVEKDGLYDFIQQRQSTRSEYKSAPVEQAVLHQLMEESRNEGVDVIFITEKTEIKALEPLILEANELQFNNKQFLDELVQWIRFSKGEAEEKRDGIWSASMGMPSTNRFLGRIIMKNFVSSRSEAKRWKNLIKKSSGFALFIVKEHTKANWVKLGRSFQRFALKSTQLGIKHAHVNMPCEEVSVRQKLIKHLAIGDAKQPLLLVRFGYAETMPYSFRLPQEQILSSNGILNS